MFSIKNKIALVTGAANGIGFAITEMFLRNEIRGVSMIDIDEHKGLKATEDLKTKYGDKVFFIKADVSSKAQLEDAFEKTVNNFKNLDIVVNNAGIIDEVDWEKTVDINFNAVIRGTYLAFDKYLPQYRQSTEGIVVNISSVVGLDVVEGIPTYCSIKHGLIGLGKSMGGPEMYKRKNIRILTICPGTTVSEMTTNRKPNTMQEEVKELALSQLHKLSKVCQSAECVGNAVLKAINDGSNGSIWVIEDAEDPYEIVPLSRFELKNI